MKIKFSIISFFLSVFISAQSYKAVYDFKWKPQKKASEYLQEDFALLIHDNKTSEFLSYIKFKNDSTKTIALKEFKKKGLGSLSFDYKYGQSKFNDVVLKNYINNEVLFEKQLYDKLFIVKNQCTIEWKINSEKDIYLSYSVQKASTEFGGRKWTAWFTTEIPVQDGPYKFHGLPGLILKLNDSENEFIYEMKSITKETNDISERNFGTNNIIKTSSAKWAKVWEDYKKQPSSIFGLQNTSNEGWITSMSIDGNPGDRGFKENFDKKQKLFLQNFENPVELINACE
jgi:GLPGLI family protein